MAAAPISASLRAGQQVMGGQQVVDRPGEAHPRVNQHDHIVAGAFQVADQM